MQLSVHFYCPKTVPHRIFALIKIRPITFTHDKFLPKTLWIYGMKWTTAQQMCVFFALTTTTNNNNHRAKEWEREKKVYILGCQTKAKEVGRARRICAHARKGRVNAANQSMGEKDTYVRHRWFTVFAKREGKRKNRDQTIWLDKFLRWPLFTLSTSFWVRVCDRWLRLSTLCACFANSDLFYFICCVLIAFDPLNWQKVKSLNRILNISTHTHTTTPHREKERYREQEEGQQTRSSINCISDVLKVGEYNNFKCFMDSCSRKKSLLFQLENSRFGFAIVSARLMNIRRSKMIASVNKLRSFVFSYDLENLFIFHSL